MKVNVNLIMIVLSLYLFSCTGNSTTENKSDTQGADSVAVSTSEKDIYPVEKNENSVPEVVSIICEDITNADDDFPSFLISLDVDGRKSVLDTIRNCMLIDKTDFESFGIPANASSAVNGWYAGGGDLIYAIIENGEVVLYHKWQDEDPEGNDLEWSKFQ